MRIFGHKQQDTQPASAVPPPTAAGRTGPERRGAPREGFSVLRVVPQVVGSDVVTRSEADAITQAIAAELRSEDRFCLFDDGSYALVLAQTGDDQARVAAQRIAVELTMRSAGLQRRKWMVSVATHPYDARTTAVLADLAGSDDEQGAA